MSATDSAGCDWLSPGLCSASCLWFLFNISNLTETLATGLHGIKGPGDERTPISHLQTETSSRETNGY